MSAWDEIHAGKPASAFAKMLVRTIGAVARARNFPPPGDHPHWDADATTEVAADFLIDSQTPRRLADLAVNCRDDDALRARLQGAIINFLRDRGRRTDMGRLVRRIRSVLAEVSGVEAVAGDRWRLVAGPNQPSGANPWHLEGAANRERHIVVPRWTHEARRQPPTADRDTIIRLAQRVLAAAAGSLTTAELAKAMAPRLGLRSTPLTVALEGTAAPEPRAADIDPADAATRTPRALELFDELKPRQRLALAHYTLSSRQLAPILGVNRTQAAAARAQAFELLRRELVDDDDAEGIVLAMIDLARNWSTRRTIGADSP